MQSSKIGRWLIGTIILSERRISHLIMRRSLLFGFLLLPFFSGAQSYFWNSDSSRAAEPNYLMDKYQDLLRYHDPIMYLSFPYAKSAGERAIHSAIASVRSSVMFRPPQPPAWGWNGA